MADKTNGICGVLGLGSGCSGGTRPGNIECGTCICTDKIFDAVKDKECLEDLRVYLTEAGQDAIDRANNIRATDVEILKACISVSEIAFNRGYYSISIRYYFRITFEACIPGGRSATFCGIAVYDKNLVLYGGEGGVNIFTSDVTSDNFCECSNIVEGVTNMPRAVVEVATPIVLGVKIVESTYNYGCCCCSCDQIPEYITNCVQGNLTDNIGMKNLYITLGIFSIIRMQRPAALMIHATDYCVPDKDTNGTLGDSTSNPCDIFNNMCFPLSAFCPPAPPCCHDTSAGSVCRPNSGNGNNGSVQGSATGCHSGNGTAGSTNSRCGG